jgi:hypothetical protein
MGHKSAEFLPFDIFYRLTFLGDSYFFPEIASRDERSNACCDNDLLHAGGDSSIENAGGT